MICDVAIPDMGDSAKNYMHVVTHRQQRLSITMLRAYLLFHHNCHVQFWFSTSHRSNCQFGLKVYELREPGLQNPRSTIFLIKQNSRIPNSPDSLAPAYLPATAIPNCPQNQHHTNQIDLNTTLQCNYDVDNKLIVCSLVHLDTLDALVWEMIIFVRGRPFLSGAKAIELHTPTKLNSTQCPVLLGVTMMQTIHNLRSVMQLDPRDAQCWQWQGCCRTKRTYGQMVRSGPTNSNHIEVGPIQDLRIEVR